MKTTVLLKFLQARPYISRRALGIKLGYSEGRCLINILNNPPEYLPPLMVEKLSKEFSDLQSDLGLVLLKTEGAAV